MVDWWRLGWVGERLGYSKNKQRSYLIHLKSVCSSYPTYKKYSTKKMNSVTGKYAIIRYSLTYDPMEDLNKAREDIWLSKHPN